MRIVDVSGIAAGEFAENEVRKDFTPSERVAILETIETMGRGQPKKNSPRVANNETAAKSVGFGGKSTANYARRVVRDGVPELVEAMDRGDIGVRSAAEISAMGAEEQRTILAFRAEEQARADLARAYGAEIAAARAMLDEIEPGGRD